MTSEEFIKIYWNQYISLEKEFLVTLHYLTLDVKNENAYSQAYAKLMLEIGSEVDVVFKEYCKLIDSSFKSSYKTIGKYKECMTNCNPAFIQQEVSVKNDYLIVQPWIEWNMPDALDAPYWWTAYNKVKHSRTSIVKINGIEQEGFKFANQKYVLLALAGLYQIMVYIYYNLASDEQRIIVTPLPGSRMFELIGGIWNSINFYGDSAFYIDEKGHLMQETSSIHY